MEQVRDLTSEQLVGYLDAVHQQSVGYLATLRPDDLDASWTTDGIPPAPSACDWSAS